jgi:AraC-like DNA-binding protein
VDPLSDVLSLLKPRTFVVGGFDLSGDWSIEFEAHTGIKCWAVLSGACTLAVEGADKGVSLKPGDCVLLPNGQRYRLAKDLASNSIPLGRLETVEWKSGMATLNGGGETVILGGHFVFTASQADMLLGAMPSVVHLRDDNDKTNMRWSLERIWQELTEPQPGGSLVVEHLAHLMLVQALRLYLTNGTGPGVGWLFGLANPQLAAAIGAIHADPGARWTLPALAERAAMSRSTFAQQFKATVGSSPIEYLAQWRMLLAGSRLRIGMETVSAIALSLGYESEAAFSTAFKRVMGCSPRQHGRAATDAISLNLWQPATHSDLKAGSA